MQLDRLKPIAKADVRGKRVIVRADLNVPVARGTVTDATRLERVVQLLGTETVVTEEFQHCEEDANDLAPQV